MATLVRKRSGCGVGGGVTVRKVERNSAVPADGLPTDVTGQSPDRNFGTFFVGLVPANTSSRYPIGPGYYSLSTLSTVPYVALKGVQGREKVFSWRETVHIPEGQTAWVKNASWHDGDIVLNGGRDYSAAPARVTVPVPVKETTGPAPGNEKILTAVFPADTRQARSAFLAVNIQTGAATGPAIVWTITGQIAEQTGHSHRTGSSNQRSEYVQTVETAANTTIGMIPLGYGAAFAAPQLPMSLLDRTGFVATIAENAAPSIAPNFYYVLEY